MLDIKFVRGNREFIEQATKNKGYSVDLDALFSADEERRKIAQSADELRKERNAISKEIGMKKSKGEDVSQLLSRAQEIDKALTGLDVSEKASWQRVKDILSRIPNPANESVPIGPAENNQVVRQEGVLPEFQFEPKAHWEIGGKLGLFDFQRAAKITGSNFPLFIGLGAKLERALINFMLDMHIQKHGYKEVFPPFLVNRASMFGTGQLPNLEEDMYALKDDPFFLIPTAEVPVTNLHRDEILKEEALPIYYTAYTACFRREAGSYGKDTKGLLRVHQFDKVELVKISLPEKSYEEHEKLLADAEDILKALDIPYRIVLLASGDLSFAAAKCYDIEIWSPGTGKWLEVSSCSNFEDFQARRANIRFKRKSTGKTEFVHTLNASGVALARLVASLLELNQQEDGSVIVPDALKPYMGIDKITQ